VVGGDWQKIEHGRKESAPQQAWARILNLIITGNEGSGDTWQIINNNALLRH
jgi:hypothetical protein